MYTIAQLEEKVEQWLSVLEFPETPESLYQPMRYALASGGKHLRPVLTLLCTDLFLQNIETRHVRAALALELFHCFSLIHDDIMDKASVRRGKPTLVARWGLSTAILAGDAMLIEAYKTLSHAPHHLDVEKTFSAAAIEVCEGQQLDIDYELLPRITQEQYFAMIGKKTAALFAASAIVGAQMGSAPNAVLPQLHRFAYQLGLAFQLRDDYLDVYAETPEFGKTLGHDILAGKKTYLFVATCDGLDDDDRTQFLRLMQAPLYGDEKVTMVKDFYAKAHAAEQLREAENRCFDQAMQSLSQASLTYSKEPLRCFADTLLQRKT